VLPVDEYIRKQLNWHVKRLEKELGADVMSIISPILPGLENTVRDVLDKLSRKKHGLAIILDTAGGIVEVVERMVYTIRHYYPDDVLFIVPNRAMSAGTVFVMSGDRILMDHFSCLGPIDPQIEKDGKLVPALSYLNQFEALNKKAQDGSLTSAEYALLTKMDLGELYQFEQARALSMELLINWLSTYKFKDWNKTESRGIEVTEEYKKQRAAEVAKTLSQNDLWHSHGRGINMQTLVNIIKLRIEDYSKMGQLGKTIREYYELMRDYIQRQQYPSFVHTREYF
jgi:hypothetical protein